MATFRESIKIRYSKVLGLIKTAKQKEVCEYVFDNFTNFKRKDDFWVVNYGGYNLRIMEKANGYAVGLYSGFGLNALMYEEVFFD